MNQPCDSWIEVFSLLYGSWILEKNDISVRFCDWLSDIWTWEKLQNLPTIFSWKSNS